MSSTYIDTLFKLSEVLSLNEPQGCNDKEVVALKKICYEVEELRSLLWDILIQNCYNKDGSIYNSELRTYQDTIDYFKEIGWISKEGFIIN